MIPPLRPVESRWRLCEPPGSALACWRSHNDRWRMVASRPSSHIAVVDAQDTATGREYTALASTDDGLERFDVGAPLFVAEAMLRVVSLLLEGADLTASQS